MGFSTEMGTRLAHLPSGADLTSPAKIRARRHVDQLEIAAELDLAINVFEQAGPVQRGPMRCWAAQIGEHIGLGLIQEERELAPLGRSRSTMRDCVRAASALS
jgi:hypothetical protein